MDLNRRQLFATLAAGVAGAAVRCAPSQTAPPAPSTRPVRRADGQVDWRAVRDLFPLSRDWTHLATFLFVSHPAPVAAAIDSFRKKIDADTLWIEAAAFSDTEGKPVAKVKQSLADYIGGKPDELCLTSNTTSALAMAYHGLKIRPDQEVLTTEHEHYSHHQSIKFAAARSGAGTRVITLYEKPADANAADIAARIAKAIRPHTRAVGVTWVHSSTGVKLPIAAIADVVSHANRGRADADRCLLIVDGVHGFGNQDVDIAKLGCDFFATGAHKWLFAPRGTGFLWGRSDVWPHLRPTIPTFDPDVLETWDAWMNHQELGPTKASYVSPGGFLAFEHLLAVPAAVELHRTIGRDRIGARVAELNGAFREGAAKIPGVTLHTPRAVDVSAGISCYEVAGLKPQDVCDKLTAKKFKTNTSPYKTSYARVAAGIMNSPEEIDAVLKEIRALSSR